MISIRKDFALKYFLVVLLSIYIAGCKGQTEQTSSKYIIPDSIYSFFPNSSQKDKNIDLDIIVTNANDIAAPYFSTEFAVTFLIEIYKYNDPNTLIKTQRELEFNSEQTMASESKDYFIIGSERELISRYDSITLASNYSRVKDNDLILNFHETLNENNKFYAATTICGLPKGYTILLLKSGNKYVMPEKYKTQWSILPDNLKHGYRSGVAFKYGDPFMIFWVVTW